MIATRWHTRTMQRPTSLVWVMRLSSIKVQETGLTLISCVDRIRSSVTVLTAI
jgi:hypothetical protein